MPARVDESTEGNYAVVHAVSMGDVAEGSNFIESTGFGPLVFARRSDAQAVSDALNFEIDRRMQGEDSAKSMSEADYIQSVINKKN